MQKIKFLFLALFTSVILYGQSIETVYLNVKDSSTNMYVAVILENNQVKSFMVLLDGFGNSPKDVLSQNLL